jgi:hypothetical protein
MTAQDYTAQQNALYQAALRALRQAQDENNE